MTARARSAGGRPAAGGPGDVAGGQKSPQRARTPQKAGNGQKPKKLKINLSIRIESEKGMDEFARILKLLDGNGYHEVVGELVRKLIETARKAGAAVPPEIEARFGNG